jgi:hypothetical protein
MQIYLVSRLELLSATREGLDLQVGTSCRMSIEMKVQNSG